MTTLRVAVRCPVCGAESDLHSDGVGDHYGCEHVRRHIDKKQRPPKKE